MWNLYVTDAARWPRVRTLPLGQPSHPPTTFRTARNVKIPTPSRPHNPIMFKNIRFASVLAAALLAEVLLVASAFAWVAFYSHVLNTGHDVAFYRAYAQVSSPFVSLTLGLPVFYIVCRFIARGPANAMAVFAVYCAIEIPILVLADHSAIPAWFPFVNFPSKFLGCYLWGTAAPKRVAA